MRIRSVSVGAIAVCLAVLGVVSASAADLPPLLRFPDVFGDTVVFVHGEDIWTASSSGGRATRLTDDEGEEWNPKFSPDGKLIAFSAEMDGNADVYVMNSDGSDIRRLTYHPADDEVVGWHPTSGRVLFRSTRHSFARFDRLFLIATDGSGFEELQMHEAGRGSFSPDGGRIVYNRIAREDRTWKRYFGGMAQDIWLYDFATQNDKKLTDYRGTDRLPMWIGDAVYFASDRDGVLNIWRYDIPDGTQTQITHHTDYDVRRPSEGGSHIVYEVAGDLWLLDTVSGETVKIPIEIPTAPREAWPYRKNVVDFITHVDVAPAGGRALLSARGEVFTVPYKTGPIRNLTRSSGARDRGAVWSPDGEHIAFFSDRDGEHQLYIGDTLGDGEPRKLTSRDRGWPHTARWSPDGTMIAFTDETLTLYVINTNSGRLTSVDRAEVEPMDIGLEAKPISDQAWSPDSRWLAYSKIGPDHVSNVYVYSIDDGTAHNVSSGLFNDFGPAFTPDGRHLLFVSNRRFDPTFCDFEWEMVYKNVAGIYALTLRADGDPLLPKLSDEVAQAEDVEQATKAEADPPRVVIDFAGLAERVEALPVPASNYRDLAAGSHALYYLDGGTGDFNRFEYRQLPLRTLYAFDIEKRTVATVVEQVDQYALAVDGEHLVWRRGSSVGIAHTDTHEREHAGSPSGSAAADLTTTSNELDLGDLIMVLDPRPEWMEVFSDAWRLERDFYYEPGMNGLDWPAMRAKYQPLVERATCAQDMRFIIGELIGELATSHTYIRTGDRRRRADALDVGLLGADWSQDAENESWVIEKIYRVPDWSNEVAPPLVGPGLDVREGDTLVAVNGQAVSGQREVFAAFQGLAGKQVRLTLIRDAREFDVVVTPVASEKTLRYLDWVERNRRRVDDASGGRIGYLHLPDTYLGSAVEFPKYFYSQTAKQGLLVDGRFNAGGLDPDIFLQRLAKRPLSYWTRRYSEDQAEPMYAPIAHMALLTNRQAGSGGDMLPWEFREKGMGPVIGTRTWGGLVGVSMSITLMDGSRLTCPDYRIYSPSGQWVVENEGVTPDIEVELEPAEVADGIDAQLEKGIEVLMGMIERDPPAPPEHPPFPAQE